MVKKEKVIYEIIGGKKEFDFYWGEFEGEKSAVFLRKGYGFANVAVDIANTIEKNEFIPDGARIFCWNQSEMPRENAFYIFLENKTLQTVQNEEARAFVERFVAQGDFLL